MRGVFWLLVLSSTCCLLPGCGHSEEEWKAQLDKYAKLGQSNDALQRELDQARAQVKKLTDQLSALGVKLDQQGSRQAELTQALEDYKQRAEMLERVKARFERLRQKLRKMTEFGLNVSIRHNRMVISLPGDVLFAAGEDELSPKGREILLKVAEIIASDDTLKKRDYQVAGHTDNEKLRRTAEKFRDNWGLSVMRAREVLVFLVSPKDAKGKGGGGLEPERWSAAGYGATDPVASNAGPDGRRKNRRVELILLPDVEEMLDLKSLAAKE